MWILADRDFFLRQQVQELQASFYKISSWGPIFCIMCLHRLGETWDQLSTVEDMLGQTENFQDF